MDEARTMPQAHDRTAREQAVERRTIIAATSWCRASASGWRLDHFLKRRIGRLSRTQIQDDHRDADLVPDGRPARPSSSVRAGEIIRLRRPAPMEPEVPRHFEVLYEDDSVLAIDKPAGLPMHTDREVLAQHAGRAAARALPRRADADRPPHRSRDVRACC